MGLPAALVTTLSFSRTLFVIVLAALFLGERVRWRRTTATLVGFGGVLICLDPGAGAFDPWTLVALLGAFATAGVATSIKRLTETESPLTIVVLSYLIMGSLAAMVEGGKARYGQAGVHDSQKLVPEGIEGMVPSRGPLQPFVYQFVGGIRAGMGYAGAETLEIFRSRARMPPTNW